MSSSKLVIKFIAVLIFVSDFSIRILHNVSLILPLTYHSFILSLIHPIGHQSSEDLKSREVRLETAGSSLPQQSNILPTPQSSNTSMAETPKPQPDVTPKSEPVPKAESFSTPRSTFASEELVDLHRKLIEKEKAVVDLEEKLATLKQKRVEDKSKLKEFEKLKMQNQQVCSF